MPVRPTNRFSYALKAMVDLALHQGTGPVTVAAIAKRQGIPAHSLEQLLNRLRRQGLVEAERGPRGGYRLRRPAGQIPVREIFEVLERGKPAAAKASQKFTPATDPARAIWQQVEKAVRSTLDATSLEALAAQARDHSPESISHRFTFHI